MDETTGKKGGSRRGSGSYRGKRSKGEERFKPTSLGPVNVKTKVLRDILSGMKDTDLERKYGLIPHTIYRWKASDPVFAVEYRVAKLSLKEKYLDVVSEMAEKANTDAVRLKAATWFLERKYPKEFSPHQILHNAESVSPLDILLGGSDLVDDAPDDCADELMDDECDEPAGGIADEAGEE